MKMKSLVSKVGTIARMLAFLGATLGLFGLIFGFLPSLVVLNPDWGLLRESFALAGPAGLISIYQFWGEQSQRRGSTA